MMQAKNFDDMKLSGEHAISQLVFIKECVEKFLKLKKGLDANKAIVVEK
jgi:hypothetical protein